MMAKFEEAFGDYFDKKTCGRCVHDGESGDIAGSTCYMCARNPEDHRIDWWEEKK